MAKLVIDGDSATDSLILLIVPRCCLKKSRSLVRRSYCPQLGSQLGDGDFELCALHPADSSNDVIEKVKTVPKTEEVIKRVTTGWKT